MCRQGRLEFRCDSYEDDERYYLNYSNYFVALISHFDVVYLDWKKFKSASNS